MQTRHKPVQSILLGLIILSTLLFFACSNDVNYAPPPGSNETIITHYSFGRMVIDGQNHEGDLIVRPGISVNSWLFDTESHDVFPTDLEHLIDDSTTTLIIGTGYSGRANLTEETRTFINRLHAKGVEVHVLPTGEAVKRFNATPKKGLLACFHLNC